MDNPRDPMVVEQLQSFIKSVPFNPTRSFYSDPVSSDLDETFGEIVKILRRNKAERFIHVKEDKDILEGFRSRLRDKRQRLHVSPIRMANCTRIRVLTIFATTSDYTLVSNLRNGKGPKPDKPGRKVCQRIPA